MKTITENTVLENEIMVLLHHRLPDIDMGEVVVRIANATGETCSCLIELFGDAPEGRLKLATFRDILEEGFYFRAEKSLLAQIRGGHVTDIYI